MPLAAVPDNPLQSAGPAAKPLSPELDHREFTDVDTTRTNVFGGVLDAVKSSYPVENDRYRLSVENPRYHNPKPFSLADQKRAILQRRTLDWPIKGTWTLTDKQSGQTLAKTDKVIARVPYMTHRGTFILSGNEYTVANQQRLRPGVYARRKDNGELESHVNLLPGTGASFRLHMEPDTGVFKIQAANSHVPLFRLLKTLGASDSEIIKAWGPELYQVNAGKDDPGTIKKLFERLADGRTQREYAANHDAGLRAAFAKMKLDPEVSQRNLGHPHDTVDKDVLLRATSKLVGINKGEVEPDDRDSQANQTIHAVEDLLAERVAKDSGRVGRNLLWKSSWLRNLDHVRSGALTPQLNSVFMTSGLGQPLAEINPVEILDQMLRVTRLGEGGIPSTDSIPDEARNVQPSQLGFIDPVLGPESEKIGVDTRLAGNTRKGRDGLLYSQFVNPRTGQNEWVDARRAVHSVLAFPGELDDPTKRKVLAMVDGRMAHVDRSRVDYAVRHPEHMFSLGSNLVPGVNGIKGGRLLMAGKMVRQALPLREAESPLVQSAHPEGGTYEQRVAEKVGAVKAKSAGTVTRVTPDGVTVQYADGGEHTHELYNHFPFNYKTFIHNEPVVQPGASVAPGQLLAKSNYTDRSGALALGTNLRVAYLPYQTAHGNNYEDAIVISRSAAKKLTSEHMEQAVYETGEGRTVGLHHYQSVFPGRFDKQQLSTIDKGGMVRPGTVLRRGDPLVLAVHRDKPEAGVAIHRARKSYLNDGSQTWDHDYEGVVTDAHQDDGGVKVTVKSYRPMGLGDKLSNRYGGKGVVGAIIPDDQMPRDASDRPLHVLLNPLGIISRTNPAQVAVEAMLGKVARKTGQPYPVKAFGGVNLVKHALEELQRHGLTPEETVYDPHTNRHLKNVLTGEKFFYKLYHTADTKETGRDVGAYTADEQPAKGGKEGAKRLGLLDINALISHGATEVLKDAKLIRGQKNDAFWQAFRMGHPAPMPPVPMVYRKFLSYLQGAGVNVTDRGGALHLMAMTDRDVDHMSNGPLRSGDAVRSHDNSPVEGGLFDVGLTGGHHGTGWSHMDLHEPLPSPVMEEPIRRVLNLTKPKFRELLAQPDGGEQVRRRLEAVNVDQAIDASREAIKSGKKSKRDDAVRLLGYLSTAKAKGMHPKDWMLSKVPVVPPAFRPVSVVDGMQLTSDANLLYKDLWEANRNFKESGEAGLHPGPERLAAYDALKAVTGLGDPVGAKTQEKGVAGLLTHVFGKGSPKFGLFQRRVLSNTLDVVGRAAITPNPSLDMDHVGLPESQAWTLYRPFIMRRLAQRYNTGGGEGEQQVPLTEIARWIKSKDPRARQALLEEMNARPVLINRAPVWHRYGYMAAWPKLVSGETLHISPITTPGFGADFDGDAMNYSLPVSDKAVNEAVEKMLPSRNLLAARDFKVHMLPRQEYLHGLYLATMPPEKDKQPRVFRDQAAVIAAYRRGEIGARDPVMIDAKKGTDTHE